MYEILSSAGLIWQPRTHIGTSTVLSAKTSLEVNKAGSLAFTMPPVHPRFDQLQKLSTECWVLQDGEEIFRGRVLYSDRGISNCRDIFCEGIRTVLNDETLRPGDLGADGTYSGTAAGLIDLLCAAYNARQTGAVPFARGTVEDFGTVEYEAQDYPQIGAVLDQMVEKYGGYVTVRRVEGQNLIDYTVDCGTAGAQAIRFADNLLDLKEHITGEEVYTVVIPLGKDQGEGAGRLTIVSASGSGGKDYIENTAAIAALGVRIAKVVTFDEIDDPDELYAAGAAVFSQGGGVLTSVELSAVDLKDAGVDVDRLRLGQYNRVYSPPHSIDMQMPLMKAEIDLLHPDNASFTFGVKLQGMIDQQKTAEKKTAAAAAAAKKKADAAATPEQVAEAISQSEGRVADYIEATGTSGIWTYEKWHSGKAVCRGTHEITISSGGLSTTGNVYSKSQSVAYPSGLFLSVENMNAFVAESTSDNAAWCGHYKNGSATAAHYQLFRGGQLTSAMTYKVDILAVGRWK